MDIILLKDVESLGHKNDTVSVRPGYANNFLIPNGVATVATSSARKVAAENIRQSAHKEIKIRNEASAIAEQLALITLEFIVKSHKGKISGTVTTAQVAEGLGDHGFSFDKKGISLQKISVLGNYDASVKLYKDICGIVKVSVKSNSEVEVVAEETPAE